ncbi:protein NEDD1 [Bombina bombina]|uniref:protein NEDD1 n=1 Tax=Bombina bombina TaxID=8345 RepID=UPI00235AD61B|nr:protein NEDD1 [Bombina bombina]
MQRRGGGVRGDRLEGVDMQEGFRFASAGDDVKIWDSSSMTVVEQFNPHSTSHSVSSLCWSSNNHFLVTASGSGDKIVVSSYKSKPVPLLELAEGRKQTCVNLNSSSQYVVSGGLDNTVNIWDLKAKRLHRSLKDHKDEVTCVTFNGNDSYVASGSMSGEIILHNVTTNLSSTPFGHGSSQGAFMGDKWVEGPCKELHFCKSALMKVIYKYYTTFVFLFIHKSLMRRLLQSAVAESPLTAVDFMPDGATLAVGSSRGKIYLYDLRMLTSPMKTVSAHKTSVQCIQFQHSNVYKSSKSSSGKSVSTGVNRKSTVKAVGVSGGIHSANLHKDLPASVTAQPLHHTTVNMDSKGIELNEDKSGLPRSTSLDVIPSKETDFGKASEIKSLESFGRGSLGDIFSPVRDDAHFKGTDELVLKGNDLDYLSQFSAIPSTRRNPVGTNAQGINSSPLHFLIGSPIKEEDESQDSELNGSKKNVPQQDLKENTRQPTKPSNHELINPNTSPVLSINRTQEAIERTGKQNLSQLKLDFPANGSRVTSPKISTSISTEVACSLSEKIADTISSDRAGAPLTSVQINFIRNMIEETLDDFREACHRDIVNLQVEMIKQFHIQSIEIQMLLERYSVNEGLVTEIEKLREENKRLRTHF